MNQFLYYSVKKDKLNITDEAIDKEIEADVYGQHWYFRKCLPQFLDMLFKHPRAIVVLASTKIKKNAKNILSIITSYLEKECDWELDVKEERIKWLEESYLYQENSTEHYTDPETSKGKVVCTFQYNRFENLILNSFL